MHWFACLLWWTIRLQDYPAGKLIHTHTSACSSRSHRPALHLMVAPRTDCVQNLCGSLVCMLPLVTTSASKTTLQRGLYTRTSACVICVVPWFACFLWCSLSLQGNLCMQAPPPCVHACMSLVGQPLECCWHIGVHHSMLLAWLCIVSTGSAEPNGIRSMIEGTMCLPQLLIMCLYPAACVYKPNTLHTMNAVLCDW